MSLSDGAPIGYGAPVTESAPPPFRPVGLIPGLLIGLGAHVLVIAAGFVASRVTRPSPGGGFEDLAAFLTVVLVAEIVVGLACLVVGTVLFVKGRRELGLGMAAGWLGGLLAGCVFIQAGG